MLNTIIEICNLDNEEESDLAYAAELEKTVTMLLERKDVGHVIGTMNQLIVDGPVYDGDILSKSGRDFLLMEDYAAKVVVKNEQGFTAMNYKGYHLHRLYHHFA
ncbi:hypothetical protein MOC16_gp134 [Klebsiella phage vB_KpM_FBKp24]|uniref:Uncharacterized protein n=1 Tax=Klebsiella phage vB_KpM_FBKp24 TaxID=2801834 RepID=A0A7U0GBS0_9CAUD|nr:hypothetical protein [Klebsiella pneumoniae]YP_010298916.1 hypothetical protein MOC16_gp134 [Klebsiella phage vB_KpM_FBKp24]QQV92297.1 hypothetical protein vBKpMFBKp24_279 [Klebsiella phage vB_KpM_FBKp24]